MYQSLITLLLLHNLVLIKFFFFFFFHFWRPRYDHEDNIRNKKLKKKNRLHWRKMFNVPTRNNSLYSGKKKMNVKIQTRLLFFHRTAAYSESKNSTFYLLSNMKKQTRHAFVSMDLSFMNRATCNHRLYISNTSLPQPIFYQWKKK